MMPCVVLPKELQKVALLGCICGRSPTGTPLTTLIRFCHIRLYLLRRTIYQVVLLGRLCKSVSFLPQVKNSKIIRINNLIRILGQCFIVVIENAQSM